MGKQSRRKRERPPGEGRTQRYLSRVGLPDRPDPGPYRRLAAADPDWFRQVGEADAAAAALAEQTDPDPAEIMAVTRARYGLLYRDLATALAEYASRPVMIAAAWLRWWFEHHPPASRLLDVGCGPGVLTCAYGLAMPDAEVLGIDAAPEAVACGQELAARLGARNVSFVAGDYLDGGGAAGAAGAAFDQVVAVTALADAGLYRRGSGDGREALSSVADIDGPGAAFRSPAFDRVVSRLSPGGWLLAFDRTPEAAQAVRLGAGLLHAGVDLDLRQAGVELFVEEGHPTTFTRFAGARPPGGAAPTTTAAELAAWLRAVKSPAYGDAWHDELRFEALKAAGARRLWAGEIDYSPHSPVLEQREIWALGNEAYGWVATTLGLRELVTGRRVEDLRAEYGAYVRRFAASGLRTRLFEG